MLQKWKNLIGNYDQIDSRGSGHNSCEVVTRMLYGNVQQMDYFYQPLFSDLE